MEAYNVASGAGMQSNTTAHDGVGLDVEALDGVDETEGTIARS